MLIRLMPNSWSPIVEAFAVPIAAIVPPGDVSVLPLYVSEYPLEAFVATPIVDVPVPVELVDRVPKATVAEASVKVSVSSTLAVTVILPAVDVATVPVSTVVVHEASEKVAIRRKKVELVALGLVTFEKLTVWLPVGAATLPDFERRSEPAVEVFTVQPEASPRLVGCAVSVEPVTENPDGVVQAPLAVVQAVNEADWRTVDEGTVKVKA